MVQNTWTHTIKERFSSLSPGQKKVAEFLLQHKQDGALLTAFQLGQKVGVSETTVIRFSYALGFSGYSQMQEKLRQVWLADKRPVEDEKRSFQEENSKDNLFKNVINEERTLLQQLLDQLDTEELWAAVDQLIQADKVYIGGFGSSHAAGYWLYYTLKQFRNHVQLSNPSGFLPEDICELNEHSVVVLFSFPRYRKETVQLAHLSIEQQAGIIAITDRQFSPIGQLSKITLTTEEHMKSGHHSIASVISLLEVIIAGIQFKDRERISHRQQRLEQIYTEQGLFLE